MAVEASETTVASFCRVSVPFKKILTTSPELPEEFEEIPAEDDLPEEFDEAVFSIRNTDRTDVDPEELSEELWAPEKPRSLRLLGFLTVLLLIAAVLGWLVLKERGLLP